MIYKIQVDIMYPLNMWKQNDHVNEPQVLFVMAFLKSMGKWPDVRRS